jgi:hypothetical protein
MQRQSTYRAYGLRNSGEAVRQFRPAGLLAAAHEFAIGLLGHKVVAAAIACMALAGLAGAFVNFWPR